MTGETSMGDGALGRRPGGQAPVRRLLGAAACAVLLAVLILMVQEGVTRSFDLAGDAAFAPFRSRAGLKVFLWITVMGTEPGRAAVLLAATALLWSEGATGALRTLWLAVAGSEVTTWVVKYLVDRPRPVFLPGVATAASPSFPSAHSAGTLVLVGTLALIVASRRPAGPQHVLVAAVATILVGTIGASRLVLNVHFPTDVLGGFLIGGFWLLIAAAVGVNRRRASAPSPSLA